MTAQIADKYYYKDETYDIIALSAPVYFQPEEYGLKPVAKCTACWRGHWCEFEVTYTGLLLQTLNISCANNEYPDLFGVKAEKVKDFFCDAKYDNLNHPIEYDGSIVIGRDFIRDYYVHMGFQQAWAYEEVYELVFENGILVKEVNHSEFVKQLRQKIDSDPNFKRELHSNIINFVESSFSLDYKVKAWWI